jgi:transcriptional regulator GlxA family with amidase domain
MSAEISAGLRSKNQNSRAMSLNGRQHETPTRRVVIVAFPDFLALDVAGPLDVFGFATAQRDSTGRRAAPYDVEVVAPNQGPIRSSAGLSISATRSLRDVEPPVDTVIVAGRIGARVARSDDAVLEAVRRVSSEARRTCSVCTGALVLAAAGLLDGKRATTHWSHARELASASPRTRVEADAIFIKDCNIYTSAGVTAGIDLALALVEEDLGRDVALAVARDLVVFARRPGGQSQFSTQLSAQISEVSEMRALQQWILEHPDADLSIEACAKRAHMSPRNFARVFSREVGTTPADWIESVRVEKAQSLLVETSRRVEEIAVECGFGSGESLRRAFVRRLRVSPSAYRQRFQLGLGDVLRR